MKIETLSELLDALSTGILGSALEAHCASWLKDIPFVVLDADDMRDASGAAEAFDRARSENVAVVWWDDSDPKDFGWVLRTWQTVEHDSIL
jgi:hypothetical protein